ncbi:MAG: lysophospholipid acyltransferase family protein [Acutalibacteraceae bacterium]
MEQNPHKQTKFITTLRCIFGPIFRVLFRVKVDGLENIPDEGGCVFCSNHISLMDPVFWLVVTKKRIHYMAKKEIFKTKIFCWLLKKADVFAVSRDSGSSGAVTKAIDIVNKGEILGIFPEGTRSKDGRPAKAKAGAAYIASATGADVVPMAVVTKTKIRPFHKTILKIGKPIPYEEIHFEGTDRKGLRNATTRIMAEITELWESGQNEL